MSHLALTDIYPLECARYGYRVVGLAWRQVLETTQKGETLGQLKARTRELLKDPQVVEQLRQVAAEIPAAQDPWIWAIERRKAHLRQD
ncbi:TPA: hypothetical protein VDV10_004532 [Pseudomonas aeruginosa]|nr:hypothetical protein [Pseudomonas aeruginosa]